MNPRYIIIPAALLAIFGLTMCSYPDSRNERIPTQTLVSGGASVDTVKHDGHLFIVFERGGVIHHPDCPCLKGKVDPR